MSNDSNATSVSEFVSDPDNMRLFQQEMAVETVTEMLCAIMKEKNVTRTELAKRLGKTRGWVTQLLDGDRNKTLRTIADAFWALGETVVFDHCKMTVSPPTEVIQVTVEVMKDYSCLLADAPLPNPLTIYASSSRTTFPKNRLIEKVSYSDLIATA